MIGNDLVDIKKARYQSNWKRSGWLEKIFDDFELQHIKTSEQPEYTVWELWSRKEAAYKAHQRLLKLQPVFNPKSFVCSPGNKVIHKDYEYRVETKITDAYIYSEVMLPEAYNVASKIVKGLDNARSLLKQTLSEKYQIQTSKIQIKKDQYRIPFITLNGKYEKTDFSLTNHGNYSAFIIIL